MQTELCVLRTHARSEAYFLRGKATQKMIQIFEARVILMKRKNRRFTGQVEYIPIDEIEKSTVQPRKTFDEAALQELAGSISECGILNPITLRRKGTAYELVAGERRLRAAKLAGLYEVPCILLNADLETASLLALVENIQRENLDFLEEAHAIERLMRLFGLSQEETARKLGKSQPAIANKLRILKLPEDVLDTLSSEHYSERHARALLRLPDAESQRETLRIMLDRHMTVAETERYIDTLLSQQTLEQKTKRRTFLMKDVRLFLNSVTHNLDIMKQGGIHANMQTRETDEALILTISIPKNREECAS